MAVRIVRLGSKRVKGEGLRIGTVRRPPRGVRRSQHAAQNWYDVWLPNLAPSAPLVKQVMSGKLEWRSFARKYRAEMGKPENARMLDVLAALSHRANFSVGCYCESEARCHRSLLRKLLWEKGAKVK